jgi:peptide/nickel transport system permease protein
VVGNQRSARRPWRGRTRRYLILLALLVVAALALPAAPPGHPSGPSPNALGASVPHRASSAAPWSTFHGTENRSGYSSEDGPKIGTQSWLVVPPSAEVVPIRTGIVANATQFYFADDIGAVFSYNLTPPENLSWERDLGTTVTTGDLWNGELLVGGSNARLNALNATNGEVLWYDGLDGGVPEGVAVVDGMAIAGTTAGSIYAVNATTGALAWKTGVGGPVAGAPAVEGSTIVVTTTSGEVVALELNGSRAWAVNDGAPIESGPAIFGNAVLVGDGFANVSRFDLANGTLDWRFPARTLAIGDEINSTPAVDPTRVYVSTFLGEVIALSLANGSLEWNRSTGFTGYAVLSSPAIAPNGLYVSDAYQYLDDFDPATGRELWSESLTYSPAYGPPALVNGLVIEGTDFGAVYAFGPIGGPPRYAVSGTVSNTTGAPLAGAIVSVGGTSTTTSTNGSFSLRVANGTYPVSVFESAYEPLSANVVVAGPVSGLQYVLTPVPTALVTGRVVSAQTLEPLAGVPVYFFGPYDSEANTTTGPYGTFTVQAPVGLDYLTASPPSGYGSYAGHVDVPSTGLADVEVALPVLGGGIPSTVFLAPLVAIAAGLAVVGLWSAQERRRRLGMPTGLFSPFSRYVAERIVLLFFQAVGILSVLYVFGTMLPAASFKVGPCAFIDAGCQGGGWRNPVNVVLAFGYGMWHFVARLFLGQWGTTSYGHLVEPAVTFLQWYGPNSIELALFALPLSAAIAYVVGLWAGAHPESVFDDAARLGSIAGLLVPSFLIVLLFLGTFYDPFLHAFGDSPYGFMPTPAWFSLNGGYPSWIGLGANTTPTGFPLIDGAIHGDWFFVEIVLLKTLWQAFAIALVYVSIYLRFVRHAVAEAFREPSVVAARARGISESTILWRHTGRRVLPMLVLVFGLTLPLYIGTQALVEALAQDNGMGTLLIAQMTATLQSGFGFRGISPGQTPQSFYQVTIFLLVLLVLSGELVADIVARYLDPRLLRSAR